MRVLQTMVQDNPFTHLDLPPADVSSFTCQAVLEGHKGAVSNLVLHPSKPVLATASDDHTWKLWHLPGGELIMSGMGHQDWVAGLAFHPEARPITCS